MNTQISIIIPVYNVEKHLRHCIDSVLMQTFCDFELLLVDDGSSDASLAICNEYVEKDTRVRVFHKANGGVSSARNLGLEHAQGKWIMFVDGDDYWTKDSVLELMIMRAQKDDLDLIRGEYISVDDTGKQIEIKEYSDKECLSNIVLTPEKFLIKVVKGEFFFWLCFLKRSLIDGLRFDENQIFLEDMKLYMQLLLRNPRCGYLPLSFYAYCKYGTSVSVKVNPKKVIDSFGMCDFFSSLSKQNLGKEMIAYCKYYAVMMYYWTLQTLSEDGYLKCFNEIDNVVNLNKLLQRTRRIDINDNLGVKERVILMLSPKGGIWLFRLNNRVKSLFRK